MREHKYRVWDKVCKSMITETNNSGLKIYLNGSVSIGGTWSTNDVIIMDYIGKLDIHDKEIFECDIVSSTDMYGHKKFRVIQWNNELARFEAYHDSNTTIITTAFEIVGNIFEDKELLN